jgi:hypothetical protein
MATTPLARVWLFRLEVFQTDHAPSMQTVARLLDPAQKSRIVFEPIFKSTFF